MQSRARTSRSNSSDPARGSTQPGVARTDNNRTNLSLKRSPEESGYEGDGSESGKGKAKPKKETSSRGTIRAPAPSGQQPQAGDASDAAASSLKWKKEFESPLAFFEEQE